MTDRRKDEIIEADFRENDRLILKLSSSQEAWFERLNAGGHATLVVWYLPHNKAQDSYGTTTRACIVVSSEKAVKENEERSAKFMAELAAEHEEKKESKK